MKTTFRTMPANKRVALVAHDHCKPILVRWCTGNIKALEQHQLFSTGTTGAVLQRETGLSVSPLLSGPMGGDQQLGALIAEGKIDALIFFWDPLNAVPHDPDVKALLRLAAVWNIPAATNASSADLLITSPLFMKEFDVEVPDYEDYIKQRSAL